MRVLTWNLFHGRAVPDVPRALFDEFSEALAGWGWDVALLQEVPPWWPDRLARATGAQTRLALTSRNWLLPLRRLVADHRPDLIKSNGGGCNAILVRPTAGMISAHRSARLRLCPERRVVHAVRLGELWVANVHAQVRPHEQTRADLRRAGAVLLEWAGPKAPVLLGGDMNVVDPIVEGFVDLGGHRVDRFLARGLVAKAPPRTLERGSLSDHAPVVIELERAPADGA